MGLGHGSIFWRGRQELSLFITIILLTNKFFINKTTELQLFSKTAERQWHYRTVSYQNNQQKLHNKQQLAKELATNIKISTHLTSFPATETTFCSNSKEKTYPTNNQTLLQATALLTAFNFHLLQKSSFCRNNFKPKPPLYGIHIIVQG